ncbi:MAG: hypothetical protein JRG96_10715 [Deltaproteobacteria bacterium]|nr:hypothetical protein [Deltaproteobacteria bacterium]MBW2418561.1 hypothetical protein [Deltaproteobacteria bacterium]
MLSGFNTNFRHRGVLFHVQTEDSGRSNPHVITHLFRGGSILASEKRAYGDRLEADDLDVVVRGLMEEQHKKMLRALSQGDHDLAIEQRLGADVFKEEGNDTDATLPPPPDAETSPQAAAPRQVPPVQPLAAEPEDPKVRIARAFGESVVSEKPLDEVVLDFLVENARKRKRSAR